MYKYMSGLGSTGLLENCINPSQDCDDRSKKSLRGHVQPEPRRGNYYVGRSDGAICDNAAGPGIDHGSDVHCR